MTGTSKQGPKGRAGDGDAREPGKDVARSGEAAQVETFLKYATIYDAPEADEAFADAFRRILPVRLEQRRRKRPPMRQKRSR